MDDSTQGSTTRARRRQGPRKPTLQDVAQHAGVSTATVSRCLSHPEKVKPRRRARVEASIAALAYTPHGPARALATQRSRTIGIIVPTLDIASFASGVQALQESLFGAGHTPLLAISNYDLALELHHARSLVHHGVDGIVLVGAEHDAELHALLRRNRIPFVEIWTYASAGPHPCIGFDNRAAMRRITEHVLDRGHRRVAMILGGAEHTNDRSRERLAGFRDAFDALGLTPPRERVLEVPYGIA
ncbi:MAG: LacI family DNA-binding transcriptional regulator, partial [Methyloligellaceae bacterium]